MKMGMLTMCLVCMLLTGCNEKSEVKSDTSNEPEIVENEIEPGLKDHELDEARRLGQNYLRSAKVLYSKGYVKQAAEALEGVQKYLEYLTAKDLEDLKALMDKIQSPVAKVPEKAPEQGETTTEEKEIDQEMERLEDLDTVVDLLITLNANIECLTCLATEIRDCLQSIEASQYDFDYHKANTKANRLNSTILTEVTDKSGRS